MPAVLDGGPPADREIPPAPGGLSPQLHRTWYGMWTSPVARLLDPDTDMPAVTRLFSLYQLGERLDAAVAADMDAYLEAMTRPDPDPDAPVPHVDDRLMAMRLRVASETRLIEAQLGMSPRSRLALGLALMAGAKGTAGSLDDAAGDANG
ncbi:hypothetical protein ACIBF5_09565 [Micromonospora sp. NPDC050417]|uniref:hypothetical protein n=1 Tax=Micromonospora sp. NPDC050417 TaxID=3364280 RepID=UPI003787EFA6